MNVGIEDRTRPVEQQQPMSWAVRHRADLTWVVLLVLLVAAGVVAGVAHSGQHPDDTWRVGDIATVSNLPVDGKFTVRQIVDDDTGLTGDADILSVLATTTGNIAYLGANITTTDTPPPPAETLPQAMAAGPGFTPAAVHAGHSGVTAGAVFLPPGTHGTADDPAAHLRQGGTRHLIVEAGFQLMDNKPGAVRGLWVTYLTRNESGRTDSPDAAIACRTGCPDTRADQLKTLRRLGIITTPAPNMAPWPPCTRDAITC